MRRPDGKTVTALRHDPARPPGPSAERALRRLRDTGSGDGPGSPGGARPVRPRRRRGLWFGFVLVFLVLLAGGALLAASYLLSAPSTTPTATEFEIMPGWGGARVAAELEAAGLVRSATAFEYYLRYRGLDRSIGEGLYDLSPTLDAQALAARLVEGGRPRTLSVLIPEGWRAVEVAARLAASGIASEAELLAVIEHPGANLAPAYLPAGAGLEGYLFPAIYDIPVNASADQAIGMMVERFHRELDDEELLAELERSGLTVHEWVILASIVQSEAASDEEMGIIAGVFVNRLDFGMLLQSDPTVAYGLGKPMPELSAIAGDLRVDTPWNTYTRAGLPFGPIGNPGAPALRAVLNPVRFTPEGLAYLYFLHGVDAGRPVFRPNTNLPAHERDVDRFLRGN